VHRLPVLAQVASRARSATTSTRSRAIDYTIERQRHSGFVGRAELLDRLDLLVIADRTDRWERIAIDPLVVNGLGILCAARDALTRDELGRVAGWTSEPQRRTFLGRARELLIETLEASAGVCHGHRPGRPPWVICQVSVWRESGKTVARGRALPGRWRPSSQESVFSESVSSLPSRAARRARRAIPGRSSAATSHP
jgi:hypothetical protein